MGNKIENISLTDSFSKILSCIYTPSPPQENFSPVIPSGITSPIPMGTNSKIHSGNISPIPPRYFYKVPEDTYSATFYKSKYSAPTNYKINLVDPDSTTSVKSKSDPTSDKIPPIKLIDSNIRQQIWSFIFNDKKDPKDPKSYNGNKNHWHKAKENWAAAISAE